jgi:hypothetical protein
MRYILSLLLIFSFAFAQKTVVIKKQFDDEKKIEVKVKVLDDKVLYTITEDGETEEYEAALDDDKALAKIHEKLKVHGIDEDLKLKVCKEVKAHDCKKEKCDPATCKHANKKECKKDAMAWHMKDNDDIKKIKIIKKHKMMDKPFLIDEKVGFLGVQIQDLSEQLSGYFKVKDGNGVLVSEVVEDSPANKAGLKAGDIITKIDDKDIENAGDLTTTIRGHEPETKVSVSVIRDGKKKKLKATLGESEQDFFYKFGNLENFKYPGNKHKMLLKMHPEGLEDFEFHGFPFDREEFKEQMDELRKQMQELKLELKELRKEK